MIELADSAAIGRRPVPAAPPRRLILPDGAWDTHSHVIGAPPEFPLAPDRNYTPPSATPAQLITMLDRTGLRKAVVVQVSVHGSDHGPLCRALKDYPDRLRGIAAINGATGDEELEALDRAGVVGTRVLEGLGGGVGMRALEAIAARCASVGWHVQLAARAEAIAAMTDRLLDLPVPFVVDHMGWFAPEQGLDGAAFQRIRYLLRNARCHVKLSGAFRMTHLPYPYADVIPFARKLVETASDRCFWGSDWPHVGLREEIPMPQVGDLLDSLIHYVSDPTLIKAILVDNPTRFYGRGDDGRRLPR